jgi:hypothetical protein
MPLTRKGAFVLSAIAIIILAIIGIAFFATFSDKGGSTLNNILDDWFSSVKAPEIGKPDIVVYGECPGATIKACGNVRCREGELKIIVSNEGEGTIPKNLTFIICAKNSTGDIIKQEVSGLKISQEKAFQFPASGDYELIADCYDQVVELDEINNVVDIDCPSQYLVNCYTEWGLACGENYQNAMDCPSYCVNYQVCGGNDCGGVNAEKYPDKLINLTDCGKCPSDEDFEGGCFCPSYCKLDWNKQIAPGDACGGEIPDEGKLAGCFTNCDAKLCSCAKGCDPQSKGRVGYVPRAAACGASYSNPMQVLQDCTSTCTADKSGRGCFCPIECDKDFALPGETCTEVEE